MLSLYYSPGAASLVVHWLLIELGAEHRLQKVDLEAGEQKSAGYLALNPNGVVPTLIVDGKPMFEAAAMLLWLADRHPDARLAPSVDAVDRAAYCQWMLHLANAVQPLFRLWWYPHESAGEANAGLVRELVQPRVEAAWSRLDTQLAARGPYLLGDTLSAADLYLVMLMRWSRNMPRPATQWPHLAALADLMKSRPSFKALCEREGLTD